MIIDIIAQINKFFNGSLFKYYKMVDIYKKEVGFL